MIESLSTYPDFSANKPAAGALRSLAADGNAPQGKDEAREAFEQFVGETFFSQMIQSMRTSVGKAPYFHGGQGEEIFQKHLDQQFSQQMAKVSSEEIAEPMFKLFTLQRR